MESIIYPEGVSGSFGQVKPLHQKLLLLCQRVNCGVEKTKITRVIDWSMIFFAITVVIIQHIC